ncbi:MAG: ribosome biogenesis GTP-binding protein YsxC, partial [Chlorobi bacterium]|nr:ribosome biogenesis GTP-binding protein YsxC [Chlorobiota bacterium]
ISSTPGKTQEINFYNVSDKWIFVDLPGYGYAAAGKDKRKLWSKLNFAYLESSEDLKLVCALIDIRHDPTSKDLAFIEWLENHERKYIIILTKSDKIPKKKIAVRKKQLDDFLVNAGFCLEVFPYSAVEGDGREQLLAIIKRECNAK